MRVSAEALAKLGEILAQGTVLDRVYADYPHPGGINFRMHSGGEERRMHVTPHGDLLDRNNPESYDRWYGVVLP